MQRAQHVGHRLEPLCHVIHGRFLGDLDEDRLARGGGDGFGLDADHLDSLAAQALALQAAVAELRTEAVEGCMELR